MNASDQLAACERAPSVTAAWASQVAPLKESTPMKSAAIHGLSPDM